MFEDFITWAGTQIKLITFYQKKKKKELKYLKMEMKLQL